MRSTDRLANLSSRAIAGVDQITMTEFLEDRAVKIEAFALTQDLSPVVDAEGRQFVQLASFVQARAVGSVEVFEPEEQVTS